MNELQKQKMDRQKQSKHAELSPDLGMREPFIRLDSRRSEAQFMHPSTPLRE